MESGNYKERDAMEKGNHDEANGKGLTATVLIDNVSNNALVCEWGLAISIEYGGRHFLLDTGASERFVSNADSLGIDLDNVEFGILSHAHFDHSDGLAAFFERNKKASFYLRQSAAENCYDCRNGKSKYIGIHRGFLDAYKDRLVYVSGDYELAPGVYLIPHKTPGLEEQGKKFHMFLKIGENWYPDGFQHEQSLVFDTPRGLVIFNSCSHGGAGAIIREVAETFPEKKIYGLAGGLHLFEQTPEAVRELAEEIRQTGIRHIVTGHCTGDQAMTILKEELGNRVESLYTGKKIDFNR